MKSIDNLVKKRAKEIVRTRHKFMLFKIINGSKKKDELCYSLNKVLRRVIIVKFDNILHGPVITFNFTLGLRMERFSINGFDPFPCEEGQNFSG